MVDQGKIRDMTKIAVFEKEDGKEALEIAKYYKNDYVGLHMIKSAVLSAIGYVLLVMMWAIINADYLSNNIHKLDLVTLVVSIVAGFILVVALYTIMAYVLYSYKYHKAVKLMKKYTIMLTRFEKKYGYADDAEEMTAETLLGGTTK